MDTLKRLLSLVHAPRHRFVSSEPSLTSHARRTPFGEYALPALSEPGTPVAPPRFDLHIPEPDKERLCAAGEQMLRAACANADPLTLAVLQLHDLPEVELVFGRAVAEQVIDSVMTELGRTAGRKGFVSRSEPDTFALLMPGLGVEATAAALAARFGQPCVIELEVDQGEILLVPDLRVHALPASKSIKQEYERLCDAMVRARGREERRREYLRKERESHTLPMDLPLVHAPQPKRLLCYPPLPLTVPVPMGAR